MFNHRAYEELFVKVLQERSVVPDKANMTGVQVRGFSCRILDFVHLESTLLPELLYDYCALDVRDLGTYNVRSYLNRGRYVIHKVDDNQTEAKNGADGLNALAQSYHIEPVFSYENDRELLASFHEMAEYLAKRAYEMR